MNKIFIGVKKNYEGIGYGLNMTLVIILTNCVFNTLREVGTKKKEVIVPVRLT
jgi:Na+-translocating ferredoxin:NAD+ oxidoreductase RnfE subunit